MHQHPRSKLGALFGMDKAGQQGGNSSLTYTAPKQPKKKESSPPGKAAAPAVTFAVAVHAYKYVDNRNVSQGKLGCAILASHTASEYSILMYVSQQQKVTTAKITSSFAYTVQPNKYAQFYDDSRQSWSILFDTDQNAIDFGKHICLAKALSAGPVPSSLTSQELLAGEGGALESGDSVEVKYTGWLLTNHTFGQVFDSNVNAEKLFRFKLGAGKVIKGWDTGVVGMKKGSKRFLVVPPAMAYGSQGMGNKVPANSTLLFEVEVVRVKLVGRESTPSPAQPSPVATVPSTGPMGSGDAEDFDEEEGTIKGRSKSISEQLAHSPTHDTSKAKLISRMAKMGKPMLPLSGAVVAQDGSEHEDNVPESPVPVVSHPVTQPTDVHRPVPTTAHVPATTMPVSNQPQGFTVVQGQPQVQPQAQPAFLQNLPGAQQMAVFQPQQNFLQQQQANIMQQQAGYQYPGGIAGQQQAVPGVSQGTDMMLMSETRQQNTEVRLSLSKVSDKIDTIMQKLDHSPGSGTAMLPNMETSVLLHNITRVVQENERLKQDVFDKSAKIETQNDKISSLLQQNQSFVEKSQVLMEQRNEGLLTSANQTQNRVLSLEQEKVELTKQLSDASSQISALQLDVTSRKKKEFELSQNLENSGKSSRRQSEELDTLKTQHSEDESQIKELQRNLREEKQSRKGVETSLSQIQEEMSDLQAAKQALEKNILERKRKAAEERRQLEDDMEDVKTNLECEIQSLKDKLRKQKTSSSAASQQQVSQIEEEITRDWKDKSERLLTVAAEKHSRALKSLTEEKEEAENKVQELENKILAMRQSSSGSDRKVNDLEDQLAQMSAWKDKYDSLRGNSMAMKERYESRIEELESEQDNLTRQLQTAQSSAGSGTGASGGAGAQNLLDEVKKIMNTVYKEMKEAFKADQSYTGTQILQAILNSIKSTTLSLMQRMNSTEEDRESEEEDSEEDEDSEEESEADDNDEKTPDSVITNHQTSETHATPVVDPTPDSVESVPSTTSPTKTETKSNIDIAEASTTAKVEKEDSTIVKSESETVETSAINETNNSGESKQEEVESDEFDSDNEGSDGNNDDVETENDAVDNDITSSTNNDEHIDGTGSETKTAEINEQGSKGDGVEVGHDTDKAGPVNGNVEDDTPETKAKEEVTSSSGLKKAGSLEDLLDSALESKAKAGELVTTPIVNTEPPPMSDSESDEQEPEDEVKDRTKSIFADSDDDDDNVADTLGLSATKSVENGGEPVKNELVTDEDLKPRPPPPLFGDDDDEDDLDWLS